MTDKRDKCEPPEGELYSGGYGLVVGGGPELQGLMVLLVEADPFGWWCCFDGCGDMLIVHPDELMPISIKDWDEKTDLDTFLYETRYGL